MIYLASPLSHPSEDVQFTRYQHVLSITSWLINQGHMIFSPIVHSYRLDIPRQDFAWWEAYDEHMISLSKEVWILVIDGWRESIGVQAEIVLAQKYNLPIKYVNADSAFVTEEFAEALTWSE